MQKYNDILEALERFKKETGYTVKEENNFKYDVGIKRVDAGYKVLFEVKTQFIELLRTFIKEEWVEDINEENIELANNEFITITGHKRTSDVLYKIKIDEKEMYFFLLELQQLIDKNMPFRLLEYMFEIWRSNKNNDKLPIIIPCVVYTGKGKWNVGDFRSLFNEDKRLEKYIPNFKYVLIDVNRYSDKELLRIANLISSVFFLNKTKDEEDALKRFERVVENVSKISREGQKAFIRWSDMMFGRNEKVREYFEKNIEKEDEKMGFAEFVPGMIEIWEGRGEARGRVEGKAETIKRILVKKLRIKPSSEVEMLIEKLDSEKLESIEDRIFDISSWEEVEDIIKQESLEGK